MYQATNPLLEVANGLSTPTDIKDLLANASNKRGDQKKNRDGGTKR